MKYEVILFDADDTLFDFKKSERHALKNTMVEYEIDYDEAYHLKIYQEINSSIWRDFESGVITQKELKIERFKRFSSALNTIFDASEFSKSYTKHLALASFLYDESLELIENLHSNYRLAIITNGLTEVQNNRIRKSTISKYFEDIVISEEVKVSKPNPKIFELALNNIRHNDKSKVLMVGDSLTSDIQGGINFGIDTCWLNSSKSTNTSTIIPTYEISNIRDLKTII